MPLSRSKTIEIKESLIMAYENKILTFINQEEETCPTCGNPIDECTCEAEKTEGEEI